MSDDEKTTKDLIQTCEDGSKGFSDAAEKLDASGCVDLASQFRGFASERERYAGELRGLAAQYGDDADSSGSAAGAVHRGWMKVKDLLAGSDDPTGVLDAAEQGEDHAKAEYEKALEVELSPTLRATIERQYSGVKSAHDTVRDLRDAVAH